MTPPVPEPGGSTRIGQPTGGAAAAAPDDAGERGGLTIADRVVERVAGHAAASVSGAGAAPRRVLGLTVGDARPDADAAVQARVDGHTATVEATVAVEWPTSVRAVTDRLRERVRSEVLRMTDVHVAQIDINVVSLPAPRPTVRRVQ